MRAKVWPGSVERVITIGPPGWLLEQGAREAVAGVDTGVVTSDLAHAEVAG